MRETIIFRGAVIRKITRNNSDTDKGVRIEVSAEWTDKVREHMGWGDTPEGYGASDLLGELRASNMLLTPSDRELKKHELQLDINECSGFYQVPVKDGEGSIGGRELRFTVKSGSVGAAGAAEGYVELIGTGRAQMRVSYIKQDELDLATLSADDTGEVLLKGEAAEMHAAAGRSRSK